MQSQSNSIAYKHDAFISYSRKNEAFAIKLAHTLETYKPPKNLTVPQGYLDVFRDKEDFRAGEYNKNLDSHLMDSAKLIVICSPAARKSKYVSDEIRRFTLSRGADNIIPVLFSGIPNNEARQDQEDEMAFPEALCKVMTMPLAVNYLGFDIEKDKINKGVFSDAWHTILANIYEISRSEIEQREKKRRARTRRITYSVLSGSIAVLTVLLIFALVSRSEAVASRNEAETQRNRATEAAREADLQRIEAERQKTEAEAARDAELTQRKRAEEQTEVANQQRDIARQQTRIADERRLEAERQSKIALSRQLAAQAVSHLDDSLDLSLLLSQEANNVYQTAEARNSLMTAVNHSPQLKFQLYSDLAVGVVAYSPDGKIIASGNRDGTVTLWDVSTRKQLGAPIRGHNKTCSITSIAFSPDGRLLASSCQNIETYSESELIRIYDVTTRQPLNLKFYEDYSTGGVSNVAISSDGKTLFSDGGLFWNIKTGKLIRDLMEEVEMSHSAHQTISPDGKSFAIAYNNGSVKLFDIASQELFVLWVSDPSDSSKQINEGDVKGLEFSRDGKTLAVGFADGTIRLWDVVARKLLDRPLVGSKSDDLNITFSPDGKLLASSGDDGRIQLWNTATQKLLTPAYDAKWSNDRKYSFETRKHTDNYRVDTPGPFGTPLLFGSKKQGRTKMSFSLDGKSIVAGSSDGILRVWDVTTSELTQSDIKYNESKIAISPDGKVLAWPEGNNAIRLWDTETNKAIDPPLVGHKDVIEGLVFSPDARLLLSCSRDKAAKLWKVADGELLDSMVLPSSYLIAKTAISPDGKTIAYGLFDDIQLYDLKNHKAIGSPLSGHKTTLNSLAFSPDGRILASASNDETIRLWDVVERKQINQPLTGHKSLVMALAFGQGGKILASGDYGGTILLWDTASQKPLARLKEFDYSVLGLAFSPDGKTLASSGRNRSTYSVQLWDVETRQPFGPASVSLRPYPTLGFSQDGNTLFSSSHNDHVHRLEIGLDYLRERACSIANRNFSDEEWIRFFGNRTMRLTCPNLPIQTNAK